MAALEAAHYMSITHSPLTDKRKQLSPAAGSGKRMSKVEGKAQAEFCARDVKEHLLNGKHSPRSRRRVSEVKEELQAEFLARDVTEHLLNENGCRVNGYTDVLPGNIRDVSNEAPCVREESFQKARWNIITCCYYFKRKHGKELEEMCEKLDIDDEQLHPNFVEVLASIWEEPRNWGRLASMFIATYYICHRLHKEGDKHKIESVIGWLSVYLKRHAVPWIKDRGGFVSKCVCVVLWLTADFPSGMSGCRKERQIPRMSSSSVRRKGVQPPRRQLRSKPPV